MTSRGGPYSRSLVNSQSLPIIDGTAPRGFPSQAFLSPYVMQVQQPVAYLDMDWYIRQCKNWDALFKASYRNVKYAREKAYNWLTNFQTLTHVDTFDGPLHWLQWEDQEIFEILKHLIVSEEEMINILKKLPENSVMHKVRQK